MAKGADAVVELEVEVELELGGVGSEFKLIGKGEAENGLFDDEDAKLTREVRSNLMAEDLIMKSCYDKMIGLVRKTRAQTSLHHQVTDHHPETMLKTGFIQSSKRIRTTDLTRNTKTAIGSTTCTPPVRLASTSTSTSATRKPFVPPETPRGQKGSSSFSPRVGTVFISLTSMAIALTATGLYQFYQSFSTWPKELRDHLRSALKAKQRGDIRRADKEFRL